VRKKRLSPREKHTIGMRIDMVQDLVAVCPKCGGEIGLWSEDKETVCIFCDHKLFERESTVH
jgi:DNA-directed RNA polymerase subunit RPC12/RpoP